MLGKGTLFTKYAKDYIRRLQVCFTSDVIGKIEAMSSIILEAWSKNQNIFICGNGGSAANAIHLANDFQYGVGASCVKGRVVPGIRIEALPANVALITCLANDTGYENIYSKQIAVKGRSGDALIILSGSGNSENVVRALHTAKALGMTTIAILGFGGGKCKQIADLTVHFPVADMQIAEDLQLITGHLCMQWLARLRADMEELGSEKEHENAQANRNQLDENTIL
jgi:D-sedoheptulose 7-phosphate isomerase